MGPDVSPQLPTNGRIPPGLGVLQGGNIASPPAEIEPGLILDTLLVFSNQLWSNCSTAVSGSLEYIEDIPWERAPGWNCVPPHTLLQVLVLSGLSTDGERHLRQTTGTKLKPHLNLPTMLKLSGLYKPESQNPPLSAFSGNTPSLAGLLVQSGTCIPSCKYSYKLKYLCRFLESMSRNKLSKLPSRIPSLTPLKVRVQEIGCDKASVQLARKGTCSK